MPPPPQTIQFRGLRAEGYGLEPRKVDLSRRPNYDFRLYVLFGVKFGSGFIRGWVHGLGLWCFMWLRVGSLCEENRDSGTSASLLVSHVVPIFGPQN